MSKQVSGYLSTAEDEQRWDAVRAHYGPDFSASEVIVKLIRAKAVEIDGGTTGRDRLESVERMVKDMWQRQQLQAAAQGGCDEIGNYDEKGMQITG